MVEVLPEPLGPRKPYTAPVGDLQVDGVDGDLAAVALGQASRADREVVHRVRQPA